MIILGVDPGTAALGYGIVERTGSRLRAVDHGVIVTSPDLPLGERLLAIHSGLAELVATHAPGVVAVERLYFSRNAQTAMAVGHARGVVLLAAAEARVPVREATPNEVKVAVAGYGAADKEQVGRMVALVLGMAAVPSPDDAADALAIAVCIANGLGQVGRSSRPDGASVLDRGASAPIARGSSPYERAVREALAREGGVRRR
ncbi:MAG TPA: crossover junction endodeoxyribonuclease RuvC [Candidatus Limnocylindrales bacterium]|nr:crossover junction endodeoxyribonuclease RuvC [Candidatus Limnocylindrales bacterium]